MAGTPRSPLHPLRDSPSWAPTGFPVGQAPERGFYRLILDQHAPDQLRPGNDAAVRHDPAPQFRACA
jgi:hypothetical protein